MVSDLPLQMLPDGDANSNRGLIGCPGWDPSGRSCITGSSNCAIEPVEAREHCLLCEAGFWPGELDGSKGFWPGELDGSMGFGFSVRESWVTLGGATGLG